MNRKYVLNNTSLSYQIIAIIMALALSCLFFSCLLLMWNEIFIVIGIIPILLYIPLHIYIRRFSEVYTDGNKFFIKSLFKKEQQIDAALFDRIVEVRSLIRRFNNNNRLYYTIYFKNGVKFHFNNSTDDLFGPPVDYNIDRGKELTKEVEDFLGINP